MNDIRPPRRPQSQPLPPSNRSAQPQYAQTVLPKHEQQRSAPRPEFDGQHQETSPLATNESLPKTKKHTKRRWVIASLSFLVLAMLIACGGIYGWYTSQLAPVGATQPQDERVVITSGMGPKPIAALLKERGLIRNQLAFEWYVRLNGSEGSLQAGAYALNKSMSLPEIVEHLQTGKTDTITITLYPGATLRDNTDTPEAKKTDVTTALKRAGYSGEKIEKALTARYDHPLFASKPASADLEGYIYGETYQFPANATVEEVLERTFDEMYVVVQDNDLVAAYKKNGLNLYEGITLASIIQREVPTATDQRAVAGVFYNRLKQDTSLGSDVTYQYIADKTGVPRDPGLDSPYNTRRYTGLPPGPIAAPGKSALLAVASPTKSDYLFFLSGDDDKTYFGKTQAEHEKNISDHCQKKCQIL